MRRGRWLVAGGGIVAVAAVCAAAGYGALPGLLAERATAALRGAGFADAAVVIDHVGLFETRGGVKLAPDQGIDEVVATYSPLAALAGRIDALRLSGVRLRVRLGPDGAAIEGRTAAAAPAGGSTPTVPEVVVERASVLLLTPAGELAVPVAARLTPQAGGAVAVTAELGAAEPDAVAGPAGTVSGRVQLLWRTGEMPAGEAELQARGVPLSPSDRVDLRLSYQGGEAGVRLDGEGTLGKAARASIALQRRPGPQAAAFKLDASVDAADLAPLGRLAGIPLHGRGTLRLAGEGPWAPGGALPPLHLQLDGAGLPAPAGLGEGKVSADLTARLAAAGSVTGPLDATVGGTVALAAGSYAAAARIDAARLTREAEGRPLRLALAVPELRLEAPSAAGQLRAVSATLDYGADRRVAGRLAGSLSGRGKSWLPALDLKAEASGDMGGALAFTGRATGAGGDLVIDARGSHDMAAGRGGVRLRLEPLHLKEGGRKPGDFIPALADLVDSGTGTVGFKASVEWGAKAGGGSAELLLKGLTLKGPSFSVAEVNSVLTATSLSPLVLPKGQLLGIGLANLGIPLSNGLVGFWISADRQLHLDLARFSWAGGSVEAEPFVGGLQRWEKPLVLRAQGLDLGQVLALATVEGLTATGTLNGRIPLGLDTGGLRIEKASLAATGPGVIRYDPAKPPAFLSKAEGSSTALVMEALSNFHYSDLGLVIDGAVGEEMRVALRVKGSNPDFYGGYPVSLNLNLSGALMAVLQQGLGAYRLPDALRERLEQYGQDQ
jgi:hypothetical protein